MRSFQLVWRGCPTLQRPQSHAWQPSFSLSCVCQRFWVVLLGEAPSARSPSDRLVRHRSCRPSRRADCCGERRARPLDPQRGSSEPSGEVSGPMIARHRWSAPLSPCFLRPPQLAPNRWSSESGGEAFCPMSAPLMRSTPLSQCFLRHSHRCYSILGSLVEAAPCLASAFVACSDACKFSRFAFLDAGLADHCCDGRCLPRSCRSRPRSPKLGRSLADRADQTWRNVLKS